MKIVIAPDSFKESISAPEAAEAIERGARRAAPDCVTVKIPVADGGEGTVETMVKATGGEFITSRITSPLGDMVEATWGMLGNQSQPTAVIEMAAASGLPLVPLEKRNPMITTTRGTGELIRAALDRGAKKILIGIGGSATTDGGSGMALALGVSLLDVTGKQIPEGGHGLAHINKIDISRLDKRIGQTEIIIASDVNNPLTGPNGAAAVYGPQKGATLNMISILDHNLALFADSIRRDLNIDIERTPGAGAAGGLGAGLIAFLGAEMRPGFDIIADLLNLKDVMKDADLVVTGEGRMDGQATHGKAPLGVARIAHSFGIPVIALAGSLGEGRETLHELGLDACFSIIDSPMSLADAMNNASVLLESCAEQTVRLFARCGRSKNNSGI